MTLALLTALFSVRFSGSSGSQWVSPNATRESVSDSFGNRAVGNPLKPTDPLNGELPDDDLKSRPETPSQVIEIIRPADENTHWEAEL